VSDASQAATPASLKKFSCRWRRVRNKTEQKFQIQELFLNFRQGFINGIQKMPRQAVRGGVS
jgi:hypothetical protein